MPLAAEPVRVVASFTILADMTERVAGNRAQVVSLVGPDGDAHAFEPTPEHARRVAHADLVIGNGLGFEGWMDRLLDAADGDAHRVRATDGINTLDADDHHHDHGHGHGNADPHAWLDVARAKTYVRNIRDGLQRVDPDHADTYDTNADDYLAELAALDADIRERLTDIPDGRRSVMTSHAAFGYFEEAYGVRFHAPRGLSTEDEPSAADVADLVRKLRAQRIFALLPDNLGDDRLLRRIAAEADMPLGETLYSDALSPGDGPAPTYVAMMRHNARALARALSQE